MRAGHLESALKVHDALEGAFELLAKNPDIGHTREDLTDRALTFWSVYSYLVVYEPASEPLRIVAAIHGSRDVERVHRRGREGQVRTCRERGYRSAHRSPGPRRVATAPPAQELRSRANGR
jgi:plasmid stabilization system protein ParE